MIEPSSPYAEAAQALQRGCRSEAERVAALELLARRPEPQPQLPLEPAQ
jgi:hypothetical protein